MLNHPDISKSLSKAEREYIHVRLAADSDATEKEHFSWASVGQPLRDHHWWLYGWGFHTTSLPLYPLSLSLVSLPCQYTTKPLIVSADDYQRDLGIKQESPASPYSSIRVGIRDRTLPCCVASEKTGRRASFIAGSLVICNEFFSGAGIYPACALMLSWPAIDVSGQTKRDIANAMPMSIGNLGAVMGTQLYCSTNGLGSIVGHSMALPYLIASTIIGSILGRKLKWENGKTAGVTKEIKNITAVED
ncbi:hypothetical protein G7046_g10148 [Stylonectria norvegica]|nr:hypothetical protein G7046_g10148 [Stylonectria norvegica]